MSERRIERSALPGEAFSQVTPFSRLREKVAEGRMRVSHHMPENRTRKLSDLARERSRTLRREMTRTERVLWNALRKRTLNKWKFVRQHPIGPYFADFVCREARLVVELDGGGHDLNFAHDQKRDEFMQARGFRVLRILSAEMIRNPDGVLSAIRASLEEGRKS